MPDLETITLLTGSYGPFIAVAIATYLAFETIFKSIARRRRETSVVNNRLRVIEATGDRQQALIELRRKRGLTAEGGYRLPVVALNRLLLQSGRELPLSLLLSIMAAIAAVTVTIAQVVLGAAVLSLAAGLLAGVGGPLLFLVASRTRRLKRLEEQLPEAVEVMVRSLRAGHPIPVAINLVAREMPDPVGSEFGLVSDEMTYGLDLPTAMGNLRERTGQLDIALLVVAISIQSKTGGNLAELLGNLGRMIRERSRMRRKIHALSAEGRVSAIALSIVPLAVLLVIRTFTPSYYGEVKDDPIFMPSVYVGLTIWFLGIVAIRRLVNFKI